MTMNAVEAEKARTPYSETPRQLRGWKWERIVSMFGTQHRSEGSPLYVLQSPFYGTQHGVVTAATCQIAAHPVHSIFEPDKPIQKCDDSEVPNYECSCGWYAYKTQEDAVRAWSSQDAYKSDYLLEVALYGNYLEGTEAYRAQYQRVNALLLGKCEPHREQVVAFTQHAKQPREQPLAGLRGVCSLCISTAFAQYPQYISPENFVSPHNVVQGLLSAEDTANGVSVKLKTVDESEPWSEEKLDSFLNLPRSKADFKDAVRKHKSRLKATKPKTRSFFLMSPIFPFVAGMLAAGIVLRPLLNF